MLDPIQQRIVDIVGGALHEIFGRAPDAEAERMVLLKKMSSVPAAAWLGTTASWDDINIYLAGNLAIPEPQTRRKGGDAWRFE